MAKASSLPAVFGVPDHAETSLSGSPPTEGIFLFCKKKKYPKAVLKGLLTIYFIISSHTRGTGRGHQRLSHGHSRVPFSLGIERMVVAEAVHLLRYDKVPALPLGLHDQRGMLQGPCHRQDSSWCFPRPCTSAAHRFAQSHRARGAMCSWLHLPQELSHPPLSFHKHSHKVHPLLQGGMGMWADGTLEQHLCTCVTGPRGPRLSLPEAHPSAPTPPSRPFHAEPGVGAAGASELRTRCLFWKVHVQIQCCEVCFVFVKIIKTNLQPRM